jgi:hypothetical protein
MNKCGPENFSDKNSTSDVKCGGLSEAVHSQLTADDFRRLLPTKVRPEACVRDDDGYIACGPIVGYERTQPLPGKVVSPQHLDKPEVWRDKQDTNVIHKGN